MGIALTGIVAASAGDMVEMVDMVDMVEMVDMVDMVDMGVSASESKGRLNGKNAFCGSEASKKTNGNGDEWK